jgi:hypothetical protein
MRTVRYEYDAGGRMIRATDSGGDVNSYAYDEKAQMIKAGHGAGKPVLANTYFPDGYIKSQVMGDGDNLNTPTSAESATSSMRA